jgi:hypothetical protein
VAVLAGMLNATSAQAAQAAPARAATSAHPAAAVTPGDFGSGAQSSTDLAIDGWGDGAGYHLEVGRESSAFAWHEIALLHPVGFDDPSWTGYQCISGDGRFAGVVILPASAVNTEAARNHGGFAYSVDLASGQVRPVAAGVALAYFSPGCGVGDEAVFTVYPGTGDTST